MLRNVITIIAVLAATTVAATAAEPLTIDSCRVMALQNNAEIHMSANSLKAAEEVRREAFTKYFPEIAAGATAFQANHDMLQYDVLDLFTLGLIKKGRTAGVWAVQPVFMGGQIVNGNKLAAVGRDAERIRNEQTTDRVIVETDKLYWNLASLKAMAQTVESAVTALDSLASTVEAAVDAGMVVSNDLLKVRIKRNEFANDLIDLNNGIALMRMLLAQQIGLGVNDSIEIADCVPDTVGAFPYDMFMDSRNAVGQTADYRLLQKNVEAKNLERRMAVGENLPKIGVSAGWFYHNVLKQNHNFGAVMLTVEVPLSGWWGGAHSIKKKSLELENAKLEMDNLSQKLQIDITDKWDTLTGSYRKMTTSHADIAQSHENLRITQAYYDAGMNTVADLLEARTLYVKSQANYITAYSAFRTAITSYLNATGRL